MARKGYPNKRRRTRAYEAGYLGYDLRFLRNPESRIIHGKGVAVANADKAAGTYEAGRRAVLAARKARTARPGAAPLRKPQDASRGPRRGGWGGVGRDRRRP